uniref:Uncharacterized protein n=1 Tax=Arion vulgaris TaxID=1028688 RepID=A0A0B6Z266_9EUPU
MRYIEIGRLGMTWLRVYDPIQVKQQIERKRVCWQVINTLCSLSNLWPPSAHCQQEMAIELRKLKEEQAET